MLTHQIKHKIYVCMYIYIICIYIIYNVYIKYMCEYIYIIYNVYIIYMCEYIFVKTYLN